MAQKNFYDELLKEFKQKLNRELCYEELQFITWVSEKHLEDMYNNKKSS